MDLIKRSNMDPTKRSKMDPTKRSYMDPTGFIRVLPRYLPTG
jgi:hypothetical protein